MLLIYNFHLYEKINFCKVPEYKTKISDILNRSLYSADLENIKIYGIEAFYFASLKGINETHLMEGWKKMNKIWTLYNLNKLTTKYLHEDKKYIDTLYFSIKNHLFYKVATSIDHLIKIYSNSFHVHADFLSIMKGIFPIMFYKEV